MKAALVDRLLESAWKTLDHVQRDLLVEASNAIRDAASLTLEARTAETLDAERYRYLRDAAGYVGDEGGPAVCSGLSDVFDYHFGPEVDEVVDEAISSWKAVGCPMPRAA